MDWNKQFETSWKKSFPKFYDKFEQILPKDFTFKQVDETSCVNRLLIQNDDFSKKIGRIN